MDRLTFQIYDEKHKEWFIARFIPHIHCPLKQQNITFQSYTQWISMKLEASTIEQIGTRMDQVQSQLVVLTIQLQDIAKGKEKCEEAWCVTSRMEYHHKYQFQTFNFTWIQEYLSLSPQEKEYGMRYVEHEEFIPPIPSH